MTATPMTPSAPPIPENPPRVLIVRAGLARLLLSICPEEAKILYQGFERASEIKALGVDGAHSSVRQHLYKIMDEQGLFPKADTESMKKGYISIPGTTDEIDPALYPSLNEHDSKESFIIDTNPYTWVTFTVPGNKICWNVIVQPDQASAEDSHFVVRIGPRILLKN
ncbi:hypothetical protein BGX29_002267 [Mortierella sp. GBA35]|nr:hypothetical protein BGX29_002267 [Mortierella sp. GBA35]